MKVLSHRGLEVYQRAFDASMRIFELSKAFPKDETYSLTDQIRRSSRSVCANLAEGWRKRVYAAAFAAELVEAEGEAAETQTWLEYAVRCGYMAREPAAELYATYDAILATLVGMRTHPESWVIGGAGKARKAR
ncbi:MAG: four helix bundle protein [Gemmataceae bacterium]